MSNKRLRVRRPRHRCPKCHSANIYKRSLTSTLPKKSRKRGKSTTDIMGQPKKYRCIACKKEFDTALIE